MAQNYLLMLTVGFLGTGLACFKKSRYYSTIFQDVENAQTFSLDHLRALDDLPLQRDIILGGTIAPLDCTVTTVDGKESVLNSYIPVTEQDTLWTTNQKVRFILKNNPLPAGTNKNQQQLPQQNFWVQTNKPEDAPLMLYNLKTTSATWEQVQPRIQRNIFQKLKSTRFQQRSVVAGKTGVVLGRLTKITDSQGYSHLRMEPKILLGENKQSMMNFLDGKIVKLTNYAKISTGIGSALLLSHFIYKQYSKFTTQTRLPEP